MKVESLTDLAQLLELLRTHGVSRYEHAGLALELSTLRAVENFGSFADDSLTRLREQSDADDMAMALAHVEPLP